MLNLIKKTPLDHLLPIMCRSQYLYIYYLIALLLPNIALSVTEWMSPMARVTNVLLPGAVYALLLTCSRKPGKMIWVLFPLVFFAAFQIVLLYLFGRSVIAVDMFLNLITTNPGEAMELLDNLVPGVAFVFIVYLPALFLGLCSLRMGDNLSPVFIRKARRYSLLSLIAGVLIFVFTSVSDSHFRASDHLYPVNVCYNAYLAVERTQKQIRYHDTSKEFRFDATSTRKDSIETYVLVIGETARACNFSLYGYDRDTNPQLSQVEGLCTFHKALTESNTTHKSVPMLLSAASASDFERIYREKSLITAFREAGFHTLFLSNQRPNHSFIDFFGMEADEYHFLQEEYPGEEIPSDEDLILGVEQALSQPYAKQLIVLHTYGSHFNYRERYPRSMACFTPDDRMEAKFENRSSLINAYDNSLRFTDHILARLTRLLAARGGISAWVYTSDHGEDIFDDDRRCFLHASPLPTYYQLHVPLWVWLSPDYRHRYPEVNEAVQSHVTSFVSTSESIFHTMLQLGGISTAVWDRHKSLCSPDFLDGSRCYLNDHNKSVRLEDMRWDPEDYDQFKLREMQHLIDR